MKRKGSLVWKLLIWFSYCLKHRFLEGLFRVFYLLIFLFCFCLFLLFNLTLQLHKIKQLYDLNSCVAVLTLQLMVSGAPGFRGAHAVRAVGKAPRRGCGSAAAPLPHMVGPTVTGLMCRGRSAARGTAQVRYVR